jgi:hypothetical protein
MANNKIYPTRDYPTLAELQTLGVKNNHNVQAVATGEFRPPHAGEWYLSGAIVQAYRAPNDLSTPYHIARLCVTETLTVTRIVR